MSAVAQGSPPLLVIEPAHGLRAIRLRELWDYRELLYFLVWRDIKVRYKQTVLGAAWAILQPLMTVVVFTLFFGKMAGIPSDGVAYPIFSFAGLIVWTFFSQGLSQSAASLVGSSNLITKVYFPRLVIPIASVVGGLVDFAVTIPVLAILMYHYGIAPGLRIVLVPALLLLAIISALGVGLWLSALNVEYRDVRYVLPFVVQLWLFVTPVIYPASAVASTFGRFGVPDWIIGLNPMAGVVEGFRWAVLGAPTSPWALIACSVVVSVLLLISGAFYFRTVERGFADVV